MKWITNTPATKKPKSENDEVLLRIDNGTYFVGFWSEDTECWWEYTDDDAIPWPDPSITHFLVIKEPSTD